MSPLSMRPLVFASLVTTASYVIFQGMTVRTNVDLIEYLTNYGGGFLAIGMTEDQRLIEALRVDWTFAAPRTQQPR